MKGKAGQEEREEEETRRRRKKRRRWETLSQAFSQDMGRNEKAYRLMNLGIRNGTKDQTGLRYRVPFNKKKGRKRDEKLNLRAKASDIVMGFLLPGQHPWVRLESDIEVNKELLTEVLMTNHMIYALVHSFADSNSPTHSASQSILIIENLDLGLKNVR